MKSVKSYSLSLLTILAIALSAWSFVQDAGIRTDGVYRTKFHPGGNDELSGSYNYLKFLPDSKVISVTTSGEPGDITKWFVDTNQYVGKGKYKIDGTSIKFQCISHEGRVSYVGDILGDSLILHIKSHINGYRHIERYYFIKN